MTATSNDNDGSEGRRGEQDPLNSSKTERPNDPTNPMGVEPDSCDDLPSSDLVSGQERTDDGGEIRESGRQSTASEDLAGDGGSRQDLAASEAETGMTCQQTDIQGVGCSREDIDQVKCSGTGEDSELEQSDHGDSIARAKAGSINLSDLPRTKDGGILIYPDIHLTNKQAAHSKDKPHPQDIGDADDRNTAKGRERDLRTLLYNIQKSHTKQEEGVAERRTSAMSVEELVQFLKEQNARDVCVIELPPELDYVQYFIVCSGMGSRHIGRMADNLQAEVRGYVH